MNEDQYQLLQQQYQEAAPEMGQVQQEPAQETAANAASTYNAKNLKETQKIRKARFGLFCLERRFLI